MVVLIEMMAEASRKRNVIIDKIEWPVAKVNRLIELYQAQPLLYNNRLKEYHNINLKNDTLKTIAAALDVTSKYIESFQVKSVKSATVLRSLYLPASPGLAGRYSDHLKSIFNTEI